MPTIWGYKLDKHLDEFEEFVRIDKNSRILDVAAGTGMAGQKVNTRFLISTHLSKIDLYTLNQFQRANTLYMTSHIIGVVYLEGERNSSLFFLFGFWN